MRSYTSVCVRVLLHSDLMLDNIGPINSVEIQVNIVSIIIIIRLTHY